MDDAKKCNYILDNGEKCRAFSLKEKGFCFSHDPESRDAKMEASRKGGLVKRIEMEKELPVIDVEDPKDIRRLLATTICEVRDGNLDIRIANTIGYLCGHLIKAFELTDVNSKLDEIKAALAPRKSKKKESRNNDPFKR